MKYVDEFRDPTKAKALVKAIQQLAATLRTETPLQFMEFCGGHTHTLFK